MQHTELMCGYVIQVKGFLFMPDITLATAGSSEVYNTDWNMALKSLYQKGKQKAIFKRNSSSLQASCLQNVRQMRTALTSCDGKRENSGE
jgi:hypothetical protein